MKSPVVKRSIIIGKHKTSVSLEDAFWQGLKDIAASRRVPLRNLVASIDTERQHGNLSSAVRARLLPKGHGVAEPKLRGGRPASGRPLRGHNAPPRLSRVRWCASQRRARNESAGFPESLGMRVIEARPRIQTLRTRWLRSSSFSVTVTGLRPR
jgi:hypothetical protein